MKTGIFPLALVCYPLETLNLHIFEQRYRQLIQECLDEDKSFVIVSYLREAVQNIGVRVKVIRVLKEYDDGRKEIQIRASHRVYLSDIVNPVPGKLYGGANVRTLKDESIGDAYKYDQIHALVLRFQELMKTEKQIIMGSHFQIYSIAHKIGLSLEQKYALLAMATEEERQDYVIQHLKLVIPKIEDLNETRRRIAMNGHFPSARDGDVNW